MSFSKRHYRLLANGGPDTANAKAERIRHRAHCDKAHNETMELFAPLTPENVAAALAWQERRIKELDASDP